jgi:putative transposase
MVAPATSFCRLGCSGALEGELDDHLGYSKHDLAGRNSGNSRNGHRAKTMLTEAGPVEISVPHDRKATFESVIVAKGSGG